MFEDLIATWQELGNMLADVQGNYGDMHPDDVIGVLQNCDNKAWQLSLDIAARQAYIRELAPYWKVTQSGADAGMPPATPKITRPLTGPDVS